MKEQKESFYKDLLENISDGIYFVDKNRKLLYWNKSAERITGYTREEVVGKHCQDNILKHIDENGTELCKGECPLSIAIKENRIITKDISLHKKDGAILPVKVKCSPIVDEDGSIFGAVEIFSENMEWLMMQEKIKTLAEVAFIDSLTGIPNRRLLSIEIEKAINESLRYGNKCGLFFIDIDKFKSFNDIYGHDLGDKILIMVSGTIFSVLRGSDTAGRWGGDEFVVLVLKTDETSLKKIGERLRIFIKNSTLQTATKAISVTVSIGGTLIEKSDNLNSLISRADKLMLEAKKDGGDKVIIG